MASIRDIDRTVFSNVEKTIADNFTAEELKEISRIAARLSEILKTSIERQQELYKRL